MAFMVAGALLAALLLGGLVAAVFIDRHHLRNASCRISMGFRRVPAKRHR